MARRPRGIVQPNPLSSAGALLPSLAERAQGLLSSSELAEELGHRLNLERKKRGFPDTKPGWAAFALQLAQEPPLAELVVRRADSEKPKIDPLNLLADVEHTKQEHGFKSDEAAIEFMRGPECGNPRWKRERHLPSTSRLVKIASEERARLRRDFSDTMTGLLEACRWQPATDPLD